MSGLMREPSWTIYFRCACGWSRLSWHPSQKSAAEEQRKFHKCPECGAVPEYSSLDRGRLTLPECAAKYITRIK